MRTRKTDGTTQRLDKYLAGLGICSRRSVQQLLNEQTLTINGRRTMGPGARIDPHRDTLLLNGRALKTPKLVYYLLHKPKGIVSTASDEHNRKNVTSLVPNFERTYPVGRLDMDTSGLIILTNDGELTNRLTHPRYEVPRVYRLTVQGKVNDKQLRSLQNGIKLKEGITAPTQVKVLQEGMRFSVLEMTIHEGRNRQVRRMCEAVRLPLVSLQRVKFGPIELGDLKVGKYRELTQQEVDELKSIGNN